MLAVRIDRQGRAVLDEVPVPRLRPGTVRLHVTAAGICHSDVNVADGMVGREWSRPFTLGHEVAGVVTEVSPDVEPAWLGEACAVYAPTGCHRCASCRRGEWNYCVERRPWSEAGLGLGGDGGMAEEMVVDVRRLVRAPGVPPEVAALLTDAGLTAFHAMSFVRHRDELATVVVVGVGGLGHLCIQLLRHLTQATIIAVDRRPGARDLALSCGAHEFVEPTGLRPALDARRLPGATALIDFVGSDTSIASAVKAIVPGADLVVVGSGGGHLDLSKNRADLPRGVRVCLPSWGSLPELGQVLALAQDGLLRPSITPLRLEDAVAGLERLRTGDVLGRLVIRNGACPAV